MQVNHMRAVESLPKSVKPLLSSVKSVDLYRCLEQRCVDFVEIHLWQIM
jgi:hypothetical protein